MSLASRLFAIVLLLFAVPLLAQPTPVKPMATDAHPSFAVASVKPHEPNSSRQGYGSAGDRVRILNESVASMMQIAYAIHPRQIVDAPDWALRDCYDIEGTSDTPGEPSLAQQREMLQKLLADRFGLKFHREKRELPVYAIQIAKGGPKLKPTAKPDNQPDQESSVHGTEEIVTYSSVSMSDFVRGTQFLQFFHDRPLINQTNLTGRYDFSIRYTWDESKPSTNPNAPPGLFTAIQEQLGLKLVPTKAPIDVFVIDHVEQPSAN